MTTRRFLSHKLLQNSLDPAEVVTRSIRNMDEQSAGKELVHTKAYLVMRGWTTIERTYQES